MKPSQRLAELNLALPALSAPVGTYIPAKRIGRLIYTSGMVPFRDGKLAFVGKVPVEVSITQAVEAASIAALNGLAAAAKEAGGLDNISGVLRVCVYVASSPGFTEQPKVANGASDLLVKIFGDAGRHARSAVGAAELPLHAPVEVELVVETLS